MFSDVSSINLSSLGKEACCLSGQLQFASFLRLCESLDSNVSGVVDYVATFYQENDLTGEPQQFMKLDIDTVLPLECSRCLEFYSHKVIFSILYMFVDTEEKALLDDLECDVDLLVKVDFFNLITLIEDELIMSLPVSSDHQACLGAGGEILSSYSAGGLPTAFSALAKLIKKEY